MAQPQADGDRRSWLDRELVVGRGLRPDSRAVDRAQVPIGHVSADPILDERRAVGRTAQAFGIRLVLGEQQGIGAVAPQPVLAELRVRGGDDPGCADLGPSHRRPRFVAAPRPGVAEPERRQEVDGGRLRAAVRHRDADRGIGRVGLGVFHLDVEVAVIRRRRPCRGARTRDPSDFDSHWSRQGRRREREPAGTCTRSGGTSWSAWRPRRSSTP